MPDSGKIHPGDVIVTRMPAPIEHYVVGIVEDNGGFQYVGNDRARDAAIRKGYEALSNSSRRKVWIFPDRHDSHCEEAEPVN